MLIIYQGKRANCYQSIKAANHNIPNVGMLVSKYYAFPVSTVRLLGFDLSNEQLVRFFEILAFQMRKQLTRNGLDKLQATEDEINRE